MFKSNVVAIEGRSIDAAFRRPDRRHVASTILAYNNHRHSIKKTKNTFNL